jgi:virginiamycin B lyase
MRRILKQRGRLSMFAVAVGVVVGVLQASSLTSPAQAAVSGAVTEYPVPSDSSPGRPLGVAPGPDGNVWFVTGPGELGRVTPTGAMALFTIPAPPACTTNCPPPPPAVQPPAERLASGQEIALGPDGALWFTQPFSNNIGRATVSNGALVSVQEFPAPTGCHPPYRFCMDGITAGPDGNVWFTEPIKGKIARLDPLTGLITEFAIPGRGGFPLRITAGPDGNLWFADNGTSSVGRSTPLGVITEFAIPNQDPNAASHAGDPNYAYGVNPGITAGSDGNLWFNEEAGVCNSSTCGATFDEIGRITTSGTVLAGYSIATNSNVQSLTTGIDGNVWFAEAGASDVQGNTVNGMQVGRLTPSGELTEFVTPTSASGPFDITRGGDGQIWFSERFGASGAIGTVHDFDFATGGTFAIGDGNSAVGGSVTYWNPQWSNANALSDGIAPHSFKGFASGAGTTPPACGTGYTTSVGNSAGPPGSVPAYLAVAVSSTVSQLGDTITGDVKKIVIVRTDPGYGPSPGHSGTGTIVGVLC